MFKASVRSVGAQVETCCPFEVTLLSFENQMKVVSYELSWQ